MVDTYSESLSSQFGILQENRCLNLRAAVPQHLRKYNPIQNRFVLLLEGSDLITCPPPPRVGEGSLFDWLKSFQDAMPLTHLTLLLLSEMNR